MTWQGFTILIAIALGIPAVAHAQAGGETVMSGRCQYSEQVSAHRNDAALILCDTAAVRRSGEGATISFRQRSWGTMARFSGTMSGREMKVARIALRDGQAHDARGTCKIFRRGDDGRVSTIACLGKIGSRTVTANFVVSRI